MFSSTLQDKILPLFKREEGLEKELKNLSKYEKIVDSEKQSLEGNTKRQLNGPARRAFEFSEVYGECLDKCASKALRSTLRKANLDSLLPEDVPVVPSKDLLTAKTSGEKALVDLVGQILNQDTTENPKPTAEFVVKGQLNKQLKDKVRAEELKCEVQCAQKFMDKLVEH
ncbi:conserved hypothetical protein [Theileria equi strain WA]|uniref:Uncharacterized protein n=1 Tax=Theileria equi strain WA TaxID=1537102 RepID=L1LF03_THEEQ|nr:conserved hypothetical protein [Theileria equi strain WA]EKX73931.1 conserved hypothetical protein [Theileria equi strain WA]|eukprot:XP_004833383.1 conserved hypothetical protein [Theileria equi strain WA]